MATREWSREPRVGWIVLAAFLPPAAWLAYQIHATIGLGAPRLWELLRTDRVFGLAMLDFLVTSSWAFLVLAERGSRRDWRTWASLIAFMVIPSVGIALFLILRAGSARSARPGA